jgi:hypothetical protein
MLSVQLQEELVARFSSSERDSTGEAVGLTMGLPFRK